MIERTDNGLWSIPGGAQELGETPKAAVIREVLEETGISIKVVGLVGIYSDPRHVIAYDNGEVRQEFSICYRAGYVGGTPTTSDESRVVQWVDPRTISTLEMHPTMRQRVSDGLAHEAMPILH